jgi:uncharacterized integral membrane protein
VTAIDDLNVGSRQPSANPQDRHHTRVSHVWTAVGVAVVLGVFLIVFVAQNTHSVRIEFFGATGRFPLAVGLLAAALGGALVVLTVGVARTARFRLASRRHHV